MKQKCLTHKVSTAFRTMLKGGILALVPLAPAWGIDGSWTSTVTGAQQWSTATNWSSNPAIPGGVGSHVRIETNINASTTVDLEATSRTVGILDIGDTVGTSSFTINGSGGGALIFERVGGAQINMNKGGNNTIGASVVLNSDLTINNNLATIGQQSLSITGTLSGAGSMTINGPGRVYLSADNTAYNGNVSINNAEIGFFSGNATTRSLGSGTITLNNASMWNPGGGKLLTNSFRWGGSLTFAGGNSFNFSGGVALLADTTINAVTNTTISSVITGSHNLIVNADAGRQVLLSAANTFTGYAEVISGTLAVQGLNAISNTGEVRVSGGSFHLNQAETIGILKMSSGAVTSAINTAVLTASQYDFTDSGTVSASLAGVGGLTKTGTGTVSLNGAEGNTYSGDTFVNGGTLAVNNTSSSATGTGNVTIASTARLTGNGRITGALNVSGALAPGNAGIGALSVANNVTWNGSDAWVFELGASATSLTLSAAGESSQDQLLISGANRNFVKGTGSIWTFDFAGGGEEGWYELVTWTGTTSFDFTDFQAVNLASGLVGTFAFDDATSGLYLHVVPEPSSFVLVASALGAAAWFRRRSRSAKTVS